MERPSGSTQSHSVLPSCEGTDAWRLDEPDALRHIDLNERKEAGGTCFFDYARALVYNAAGRYEHALEAAQRSCERNPTVPEPAHDLVASQKDLSKGRRQLSQGAPRRPPPQLRSDASVPMVLVTIHEITCVDVRGRVSLERRPR